MTEERGDGKPVGQGADHAGLGRGADVSDPLSGTAGFLPPTEDVDHRREAQKASGEDLHLAKVPTLGGVVEGGEAQLLHPRHCAERCDSA